MLVTLLLACLNPKDATPSTQPDSCVETAMERESFELFPTSARTQIQVASALADDRIWLAWNEDGPTGAFETYAGAIGCDGSIVIPAQRLDEDLTTTLDPSLAIHGDTVLVAWQEDDGSSPDNLSVHTRTLDRVTGEPTRGPRRLELERAGAPFVGNLWMTSVTRTSGGFAIAANAGIDDNFRIVLTELDLDGMPTGTLLEPLPDSDFSQQAPVLAAGTDGLHLVFDGSSETMDGAWYSFDGGPAELLGAGSFPSVDASGTAIWGSASGLQVGTVDDSTLVSVSGVGGAIDQGFVTWSTPISGFRNRLVVATVDGDNEVDLGTEDAPPYARNLVQIHEGLVFTAWQEGTNPEFRLRGAFVAP